jgi:hypothetical protein
MERHPPLSRAGAAKFPATDGAGPDRSRPFKTKLKLETLILCDYTHFTGKTRGANGRTVGCCHSPFHVTRGKLHE